MLSYFRWVLFFVALFATVMGGALFLGHTLLTAPGPLEQTKNIVIPRGAGPATMAKVLKDEGVIAHSQLFRVALMIDPTPKPIKAGEYEVPAHISMQAMVDLLQSGKVVQRRLTVPEGMTTAEVVDLVRKTEALVGEITLDLKEGDLLPETYFYSRDDTRDGLLSRMKEAMDKTLDEAWRKRVAGLPLANRREALILASLIEKETAIPAERRQGRRGVHQPAAPQDEARKRSDDDLRPDRRQGAAQSRADARRSAIDLAVQHLCGHGPAAGPDLQSGARLHRGGHQSGARDRSLYFVADGQGGHVFAGNRRRTQPQCRTLAADPARARGAAAAGAVGCARRAVAARAHAGAGLRHGSEPCRSCFWSSSCWRPWPSASPGSCAPTRRHWRASCGLSWWCWAASASAAC